MRLGSAFRHLAVMGGSCLLLSGNLTAQAYTIFTDRTAWETAVTARSSSILTDSFDNDIEQAQLIQLDSGVVSTNSLPPAVGFDDNSVLGGEYINATEGDAEAASLAVTWDLPSGIFAFGADFANILGDGDLTMTGDFDGTGDVTLSVFGQIGDSEGFLGIVGDSFFDSVVFSNSTNEFITFTVDNASFGTVPEPSMVLALAVIGGSVLVRGRKQNS